VQEGRRADQGHGRLDDLGIKPAVDYLPQRHERRTYGEVAETGRLRAGAEH
jgi:hypothetical protein